MNQFEDRYNDFIDEHESKIMLAKSLYTEINNLSFILEEIELLRKKAINALRECDNKSGILSIDSVFDETSEGLKAILSKHKNLLNSALV